MDFAVTAYVTKMPGLPLAIHTLQKYIPFETNLAPENGWLQDYFRFGKVFQPSILGPVAYLSILEV